MSDMPNFTEIEPQLNHIDADLADEIIDGPSEETSEESDDSQDLFEEMSEVEVRLEEANCYKALLRQPLFKDGGPIAQKVQKKIHEFIRKELRYLIGLEIQPKTSVEVFKSSFSKEEELALKEIAGRLIERHRTGSPPKIEAVTVTPPVNKTPIVNMIETPEPVMTPKTTIKKTKAKIPKAPAPTKKEKVLEREVLLPNGQTKMVKINPREQTRNANAPTYTPQQIADMQATQSQYQALHSTPTSGILGLAYQAANNDLIKTNNGE